MDGSSVEVDAEIAKAVKNRPRAHVAENLKTGRDALLVRRGYPHAFLDEKHLVPLSIAFIDSSGTIREYDMKPGDLSVVSSTISMRYALEVPSGWFDRVAIEPGCRLDAESLALLKAIR